MRRGVIYLQDKISKESKILELIKKVTKMLTERQQ